jgi:hypothetical protein
MVWSGNMYGVASDKKLEDTLQPSSASFRRTRLLIESRKLSFMDGMTTLVRKGLLVHQSQLRFGDHARSNLTQPGYFLVSRS